MSAKSISIPITCIHTRMDVAQTAKPYPTITENRDIALLFAKCVSAKRIAHPKGSDIICTV